MTRTNFIEAVTLEVSGEPARRLSLQEAIQIAIALPQKADKELRIVRDGRPAITDYRKMVALFGRSDFPTESHLPRWIVFGTRTAALPVALADLGFSVPEPSAEFVLYLRRRAEP